MVQKKIIWFAIVLASFIYALIVYFLSKQWPTPGPFDEAVRNQLVLILYVAAIGTFIVAFVFPRMMQAKQTAFVASLALFESVAIFGLLAAFLRQDWRLFIAPWILAMIGFATKWPSESAERH
ncbi:MAG TPA: hypothetical protein VNA69_18770 [Thermoanaerobaculia bacterium]|nr:hypothetical protein [Thermoanaerobaculia bacterium]